jgi:ATP-dependent DNA ligase
VKGIVSKRLGYPYRSGRVNHWRKIKNPAAAGAEAGGGRRLGC